MNLNNSGIYQLVDCQIHILMAGSPSLPPATMSINATVAQLVERRICNPRVEGANPSCGSLIKEWR